MQVSVETTEGLERRMKVSIPAERIDTEVANRLRNISRTARLKGFRPGKVPMKVVESRYGSAVRREVVDEVTRSSFFEAVSQEKLPVIGPPRFRVTSLEPGIDLQYEAVFEVLADIDLAPLDDVTIRRPAAEITEADVDNMLDNLRRQRGEWRVVEREAANDDRLVIDFVGRIGDEEFQGNRGEQVPLVLGAGQFIPGFEDGLVGATAGETRNIAVRFPDDYHVSSVAGKDARFDITVHSVSELVPADVDEDFVRSFEVAEGTEDALREELRKTMQEEMEQAIRERVRHQALDALYDKNADMPLPRSQVEAETDRLARQAHELMRRQGVPEGEIRVEREAFTDQARRRVALGLLVMEVSKAQEFKAEPDRVRERVQTIASAYDDPDEVMKWYFSDRERLGTIEQLVLEDQVVDWIASQARLEDEPTDFQSLLKERQGRA